MGGGEGLDEGRGEDLAEGGVGGGGGLCGPHAVKTRVNSESTHLQSFT
jgi:hypothetical protein